MKQSCGLVLKFTNFTDLTRRPCEPPVLPLDGAKPSTRQPSRSCSYPERPAGRLQKPLGQVVAAVSDEVSRWRAAYPTTDNCQCALEMQQLRSEPDSRTLYVPDLQSAKGRSKHLSHSWQHAVTQHYRRNPYFTRARRRRAHNPSEIDNMLRMSGIR